MEFEKSIGIDDLIYKAEIETQTQRTNIWRPREWRVGEMNWEIEIDRLLILCTKQITNG